MRFTCLSQSMDAAESFFILDLCVSINVERHEVFNWSNAFMLQREWFHQEMLKVKLCWQVLFLKDCPFVSRMIVCHIASYWMGFEVMLSSSF